MAEELLNNSEQVERLRQAVMKLGGSVTIGDVMTETGLGLDETKACMSSMMVMYEGTMRVSEKGEILYVFPNGGVLRDQRTWWERNRKAVMKVIKTLFKIIIMLVLVVYFVIFMCILIAILCSGKNRNSRIDIGWIFWMFWGRGDTSRDARKDPLYTRVYNFVFGPEEPEIDPMEARSKCAQLIRAKNGVITVEDWIMISGQSREKCESDLARFTAEFDGTAEITDNGTLVYVFESMTMSGKTGNKKETMPACSWEALEHPRPLSGNTEENGGDGAVIGLNLFNLIMSIVLLVGASSYLDDLRHDPYRAMSAADIESAQNMVVWLGIFPLVFSSLIFAGPLVRLPGNIKENKARRERSVHKAVLKSILGQNRSQSKITYRDITQTANRALVSDCLPEAEPDEISHAVASICDDLQGEVDLHSSETTYSFDIMDARLDDAQQQRSIRQLDKQEMGRVVYSSNNDEQERIDDENTRAELEDFDRQICGSDPAKHSSSIRKSSRYSSEPDDFDSMLSGSSYNSDYSSRSDRSGRNSSNMF